MVVVAVIVGVVDVVAIVTITIGNPRMCQNIKRGRILKRTTKVVKNIKMVTNLCYRCGMKGHWSRTCRTPKHLVDLYQESLKKKDKKVVETNFISKDESVDHDLNDMTHLDVADFFYSA